MDVSKHRRRDAVLLECGHGGLCVDCASALWVRDPVQTVAVSVQACLMLANACMLYCSEF